MYYHFFALILKLFYRIVYMKQLNIGAGTTFRSGFKVMISDNGRIDIGDNCFFNHYCSISSRNRITIGNNTIMGENVKIMDHNHRFRDANVVLRKQGFSDGEVSIGNNTWIGSNVVILKGTHIGNHCVIGAGCVIDFEVPDNKIVKMDRQYCVIQIEDV